MISEIKYLFKSTNKRLLSATLVFGLVVSGVPIAATHAEGVSVIADNYTDGSGGAQGMDVYTTGGNSKPGIIFVHGGGWRAGDKSQYDGLGRTAAQRGYVGVSINYRLGSAGVYYQYEDVMKAVQSVRDNADKYGIDTNRIAIWGDSAGGSLAMRVATTPEAGIATAIGWSAPVNAYTAIFNSLESFAIGLDHSTCVPTSPAGLARLQNNLPASAGGQGDGVATPITQAGMLELLGLGSANNSATAVSPITPTNQIKLPTIVSNGKTIDINSLSSLINNGVTSVAIPNGTTGLGSNVPTTSNGNIDLNGVLTQLASAANSGSTSSLADNKALKSIIGQLANGSASTSSNDQLLSQGMSALSQAAANSGNPQLQQASSLAAQLATTTDNNATTDSIYDPTSTTASDSVKANAGRSPSVAGAMHTAEANVSAEVQRAILAIADTLGCQDNFRVMSPILAVNSKTPPTFLANAQSEFLVHPGQALEYADKLRGLGIDSEALILPGNNHMGYDDRAVEPSFNFLAKHLRP